MAPTLRARHGKIVPVNVCSLDNRKAIGKMNENAIVMTRKKRLRISDDSLLDMFCFFKRRELCSFELVNRRMKRVVELGDQKKQLRQRIILDEIHFSVWFFFTFA